MTHSDRSHDPARTSWVRSANGHPDFPIQNLPFASIRQEGTRGALVTAIGDQALHLGTAMSEGWGSQLSEGVRAALAAADLNALAGRPGGVVGCAAGTLRCPE